MDDKDTSSVWLERLAETIAWSLPRTNAADPRWSLRSPELLPKGYRSEEYSPDSHGLEPDIRCVDLADTVNELAQRRSALLQQAGWVPSAPLKDLAGGRLLCYLPCDNLAEGCEEPESRGFYDVFAAPPWATWIAWSTAPAVYQRGRGLGGCPVSGFTPGTLPEPDPIAWGHLYIICWVPAAFIALADAGLRTSTTYAVEWADFLDADWLRHLWSGLDRLE